MDQQLIICLIVFFITVIFYVINRLPLWLTAMISLGLLYVTGCLDEETALGGFSDTNTIMMAGMFLMAAGFQRTSVISKLCDSALRMSKGSFTKVFAIYMILTVILTNLISSPNATYSIICPLLAELCDKTGTSRSKVMFPALAVTVGCFGLLPFASAVAQATQANGFLETYGFEMTMSHLDFFKGKLPMLILLPLWAIFIGPKVTPQTPVAEIMSADRKKTEKVKLTKFQDIAAVTIFFADLVVLVFSRQLNVETWFVAFVGGILMVLSGALDRKNALKSIPWDMIVLFVGSLGLGNALTNTGAGQIVGDLLANAVGGVTNSYVLGALFFIVPFTVTQFMQNRAVNLIFTPICLMTCKALGGTDPTGLVLLVTAGSLTSFLTPMATGAVSICMAEGGYDVKSLLTSGWSIALIATIAYVSYTMTVYPVF